MTVRHARGWLITASLAITTCVFLFLLLAPGLGYPLEFPQAVRLLEILVPVFLGYLGSAAHFVFSAAPEVQVAIPNDKAPFVSLMIRGPVIAWAICSVAVLVAFGFSNRAQALDGEGMSVDQLAAIITSILGILSATTSVAVSFLFGATAAAVTPSTPRPPDAA